MQVTIATLSGFVVTLDVSPDMDLQNFKAICECEVGIPSQEIVVTYEGRPLLEEKLELQKYGIHEGDLLLLQQFSQQPNQNPGLPDLGIDFSAIKIPGAPSGQSMASPVAAPMPPPTAAPMQSPTTAPTAVASSSSSQPADEAERLRQHLLQNPGQVSLLRQNNPRLADAYLSGNLDRFREVMKSQLAEKAERERKRIQMLNSDPFDMEAQKLIAEEIRMDNVDSNMEAAIEYHPESFGQVTMLYINCKVNGHPVKAFIDSGAQTTIMSQACAERCAIMRLVDRRWAGIAKGVGVQKIIGRVHLGQIQIDDVFLTSSFSILENQPMDMLLGLDMLKRHQCCIDLKRNILVIGTTGTETPFLTEGELPIERHTPDNLGQMMG